MEERIGLCQAHPAPTYNKMQTKEQFNRSDQYHRQIMLNTHVFLIALATRVSAELVLTLCPFNALDCIERRYPAEEECSGYATPVAYVIALTRSQWCPGLILRNDRSPVQLKSAPDINAASTSECPLSTLRNVRSHVSRGNQCQLPQSTWINEGVHELKHLPRSFAMNCSTNSVSRGRFVYGVWYLPVQSRGGPSR